MKKEANKYLTSFIIYSKLLYLKKENGHSGRSEKVQKAKVLQFTNERNTNKKKILFVS